MCSMAWAHLLAVRDEGIWSASVLRPAGGAQTLRHQNPVARRRIADRAREDLAEIGEIDVAELRRHFRDGQGRVCEQPLGLEQQPAMQHVERGLAGDLPAGAAQVVGRDAERIGIEGQGLVVLVMGFQQRAEALDERVPHRLPPGAPGAELARQGLEQPAAFAGRAVRGLPRRGRPFR